MKLQEALVDPAGALGVAEPGMSCQGSGQLAGASVRALTEAEFGI